MTKLWFVTDCGSALWRKLISHQTSQKRRLADEGVAHNQHFVGGGTVCLRKRHVVDSLMACYKWTSSTIAWDLNTMYIIHIRILFYSLNTSFSSFKIAVMLITNVPFDNWKTIYISRISFESMKVLTEHMFSNCIHLFWQSCISGSCLHFASPGFYNCILS